MIFTWYLKNRKKKNKKALNKVEVMGFSIIELSIILTIFSFFAVNAIITEDTTKAFGKYYQTTKKLDRIKEALSRHVKTFGHYPCPANGETAINTNTIGESDHLPTVNNDPEFERGIPKCASAKFRAPVSDKDYLLPTLSNYTDVMVGTVPIKELGLPVDYMIDSFGNRITYAVRKDLISTLTYTMSTSADGNASPPFGSDPSDALPAVIGSGPGRTIEVLTNLSGLTLNGAYVLISHGPNGYGAWPFEQGIPISSSSGAQTTRIPPPDIVDITSLTDCSNPTEGTFSQGELRNHHLCREARDVVINAGPCTAPCSNIFDNQFYSPYTPETSPGSNAVLYDDIVAWGEMESHDRSNLTNLDTQNSLPMIDFYEGTGEGPGPPLTDGSRPDAFQGLALWMDAKDCRTMIVYNTPLSGAGSGAPVSGCDTGLLATELYEMDVWAEKISIHNNFFRDSITNSGTITGTKGVPETPTTRPYYTSTSASGASLFILNDNSNAVVSFPGITFDHFMLHGPNLDNNQPNNFDDPNLRPSSITVFVVGKMINQTNLAQTFFSRNNLADEPNPLLGGLQTQGYSLMSVGPSFDGSLIGFAINDFYHSNTPTVPTAGTFASLTGDTSPHIFIGMYDEGATPGQRLSLRYECNGPAYGAQNTFTQAPPEQFGAGSYSASLIGKAFANLNTGLSGSIGEVVVYNRALTDWERAEVTRYLADKWDFPAAATTGCSAITQPDVNNTAPPNGCFPVGPTQKLLGTPETASAANCCSLRYDTIRCCMEAGDAHNRVERCKNDNECCNDHACSAFGYCYKPYP